MSASFSIRGFVALLKLSLIARLAFVAWIGLAAFIGYMAYSEVRGMNAPRNDAGWPVFELGFEYQRLLLAAETGESLDAIRFRGDIYLSRVIMLRDAPLLAEVRARMMEPKLAQLLQSAQETERRLAALDGEESREALLAQLRRDAGMMRSLMLHMGHVNRSILLEQRHEKTRQVLLHLVALKILMLTLFAVCALMFWTWAKLRETARKLELQLARQDTILKLVDTGIIGLGPGGSVLYCNPAAQALIGAGPCGAAGAGVRGRGLPATCGPCCGRFRGRPRSTRPARSGSNPPRACATM